MVTLTIAPPCPMLLREAGSRRGRLQGTDGRMINRRTGSGKRARNPAGSRFKPGEPSRPAPCRVGRGLGPAGAVGLPAEIAEAPRRAEGAEAQEGERGRDQTHRHREDPKIPSNVY